MRDPEEFRKRFARWKSGENYWKILAEAEDKTKDLRELYDYVGYLNLYGSLYPSDPFSQHYPDTYKLPGHPTFSVESKYSNKNTPGGTWRDDGAFVHSDWTINHPEETRIYLELNDPDVTPVYNGGRVLPQVTITPKYKDGKDSNNIDWNDTINFITLYEGFSPTVYQSGAWLNSIPIVKPKDPKYTINQDFVEDIPQWLLENNIQFPGASGEINHPTSMQQNAIPYPIDSKHRPYGMLNSSFAGDGTFNSYDPYGNVDSLLYNALKSALFLDWQPQLFPLSK